MVFLAVTGLAEFYGLAATRGLVCFERWGIFGGLLLMVGTFLNLTGQLGTSGSPARVNDFETSFLILFVLGLCLRQFFSRSNTAGILAISTTLFGLMYVPWLLNFIQKINFFPGVEGHYYLLYFVVITKFSDTGAYATGSLIGRHKMIPRISPGKTWEGFAGAVVVSTLASLIFVHFLGSKHGRHELGTCDHSRSHSEHHGGDWGLDRIAFQTRGRGEGLRQVLPRHRWDTRLAGQFAV